MASVDLNVYKKRLIMLTMLLLETYNKSILFLNVMFGFQVRVFVYVLSR